MRAKVIMLVLALAATAISLLAIRQQRLQAVSEMATAIERAATLERLTWRVRVEINARVEPEAVRKAASQFAELAPILPPSGSYIDTSTPLELTQNENGDASAGGHERSDS